jgi:uncharacterized protein (DUF488 family)
MITREKIILNLIHRAGGEVSRLNLVKLAFLFRQESQSDTVKTFYQFLPYLYGPFSFTLYHELDDLMQAGMLTAPTENDLRLGDIHPKEYALPKEIQTEINRFWNCYGGYSTSQLVEMTYRHFPWYTLNTQDPRKRNAALPRAKCAVYTAGYAGMQVDGFLNLLLQKGIRRLIDVRNNPISRRYGFHKSTLERTCQRVGLEYQHTPELGIPSALRSDLGDWEDYERLFARYEERILPANQELIRQVAAQAKTKPSVLICQEADPTLCHRTRLGKVISKMTGLELLDLGESA